MTAARMNEGKPELGYLLEFPTAVEAFARVKMLGAAKYERGNWKKGGKPDNEYIDACLRHLMAFVSGETFASDSGCPHLAHAIWNLFALMELNHKGVTHDPELFNKMMKYWEEQKTRPKDTPVADVESWAKEIKTRFEEAAEKLKVREELRTQQPVQPTVFDSRRAFGGRWYHAEPWAQDEFDRALNREEKHDTK